MTDGAAADERLRHLGHGDGGVHARIRAAALESVLQRQRVDHRGQHAHVIAGHAVDAFGGGGDAAKDVATADDDGDLDAGALHVDDLVGDVGERLRVDAGPPPPHQRLAGKFQKNATVPGASHSAGVYSRAHGIRQSRRDGTQSLAPLPRHDDLRHLAVAAVDPGRGREPPLPPRGARVGHQLLRHREHVLERRERGSVGRALRDFARRDEVVIATKVFFPTGKGPNDRGLSRKHIMTAIDDSLRRLGTGYVDLYQIHRWDYHTPIEETVEALHDVVKSGKARYV